MLAGSHQFKFALRIPPRVVPSLTFMEEQVEGKISHHLHVKIDQQISREAFKTQKEFLCEVHVDGYQLDVSAITRQLSAEFSQRRRSATIIGEVETEIQFSKTIFFVGDFISAELNIRNNSAYETSKIVAKLVRQMSFNTKQPRSPPITENAEWELLIDYVRIMPRTEVTGTLDVILPDLEYPSIDGKDNLIQLKYYLILEVYLNAVGLLMGKKIASSVLVNFVNSTKSEFKKFNVQNTEPDGADRKGSLNRFFGDLDSELSNTGKNGLSFYRGHVVRYQDEDKKFCPLCFDQFTFFSRRHHCRKCGNPICDNCGSFLVIPELKNNLPLRVCKVCISQSPPK